MVINRKKYPTSTGMQAVHQVEKGEQTEHINIHKFNWEEFWHLFFWMAYQRSSYCHSTDCIDDG